MTGLEDAGQPTIDPVQRMAAARMFDAGYYLSAYPFVADLAMDPLDHFMTQGWRNGFNPCAQFNTAYYLATNADVARSGMNPLAHFVFAGQPEGRLPRRPNDTERAILELAAGPSFVARYWAAGADLSAEMPCDLLETALLGAMGRAGLALSISHDDYTQHYGGIQYVIESEQQSFASAGWSYLHVCPAAPLPMLAGQMDAQDFRVRLTLDGERLGIVALSTLNAAIRKCRGLAGRIETIFHHLMGHVPELLVDLVAAAGSAAHVWAHDFFTICPRYDLMRNDVRFCGGPPVDSGACDICAYGEDRRAHVPRIAAFFAAINPIVLAPSASALETWTKATGLVHRAAIVLPLARLLMGDAVVQATNERKRKLRIAHIGARSLVKGWAAFEALALRYADDGRYSFLQLGVDGICPLPGCIRHVPVRATPQSRQAMVEAVAQHRIDVVVSWSVWPETFCFAVHEALAGGAFVAARKAAGNVWPAAFANAPLQCCPVENEQALDALFASGRIRDLALAGSRAYGAILEQGGTADWLVFDGLAPTGLEPEYLDA